MDHETMKGEEVAIGRCRNLGKVDDISAMLKGTLGLIDAGSRVRKAGSALIKPNVCWGEDWKTGGTTSPLLIGEMVSWLRGNGIDSIMIAEGSMVGHDTLECFESTGIKRLAEQLDVPLIDLNRDEKITVKVPKPQVLEDIEVSRTVMECEFLINMPVMKTHINTMVTLSLKNLKGAIDHRWKRRFHLVGLDSAIADLGSAIRQDLIVLDGLVGQEGQGPLTGNPANAGIIMASADPLAMDFIASKAMGFDPSKVGHLCRYAEKRGIGIGDYSPPVVGIPLGRLRLNFAKPKLALKGQYDGVEILWGDPCSGCAGALSVALDRLADSGALKRTEEVGPVKVAIGANADPAERERLVLIGRCQYRNRGKGILVPGCPPPGTMVKDAIGSLLGLKRKYDDEELMEEAREFYE